MEREFTSAVIEAKDEGILDRDELIRDLLNYLSDSEVRNFLSKYYCEFYGDLAECGKDVTIYGSMYDLPSKGDYDGQPAEFQEWHDFDPDC